MQPNTDITTLPPAVPNHSGKRFNPLVVVTVALALLLIGALGFGVWAYGVAQDYRRNVNEKVNAQLAEAVSAAEAAKEAEFAEREKHPLKEYRGPAAFGSVVVKYPKTWSAFVTETSGGTPVDGYFHPNFVPGTASGTAFALRVEIISQEYAQVLQRFEAAARRGEVSVTVLRLANVPNVTGARVHGQIERDRRGSVALFPLRDKTLRLTTQSEQFLRDFNDIILANLQFSP